MKKLIVIAVLTIATTLTACTTPQNAPAKAAEHTQDAPKVTDEAPAEDEEKPEVTEAPSEAVTEEPEASKAPAPTVSEFEGFVGEWTGTVNERYYDSEKEEYVETGEVLTALLDIRQDGTWSLVFDGSTTSGMWENISSSGRAINLLVEVSYSDEPQDNGWSLICVDKTILHLNHWGSYDVELTRI